MTVDDVKKESFFQQLSDGQKKFVLERCSGRDNKNAAKLAWSCKTDASAISMANKAMQNANIKWLVNRFFGVGASHRVPTAEELAAWNWDKAQSCGDPALCIKFADNVAKIMGYLTRAAEPPARQVPDDGNEEFEA